MSERTILELWFEYCRLLAYSRLYILLSRRKVNKYILLKGAFIYILGLPMKILRLLFYFIYKNRDSFREGLEVLYYDMYYKLQHSKIEIYSRKIYINCYNISKLLTQISNKNTSKNDLFNFLKKLRDITMDLDRKEKDFNRVKMIMGVLETDEGSKTKIPHFMFVQDKNTIHMTSKVPKNLDPSQERDMPISSLILTNSSDPGTIVSKNVRDIRLLQKSTLVKNTDLMSIMIKHPDKFYMDPSSIEYMYERQYLYDSLLQSFFNKVDRTVSRELGSGLYTHIIINSTDMDLLREIEFVFKDSIKL